MSQTTRHGPTFPPGGFGHEADASVPERGTVSATLIPNLPSFARFGAGATGLDAMPPLLPAAFDLVASDIAPLLAAR
ncbi:hypothetical protein [Bosea sp. BIWAKO-01]|uniref:hypothetical protein n=1 Tax=Bosea sp. BIWAKO-01 TaxID=506668 RepID=UPI000852F2C5|nr:hypothetical protein [Bosea sp. BIWAKO-01]GAU86396.1 hypothetical protein BIWAKO_06344 [Bosea sp. BIWAKO-01]